MLDGKVVVVTGAGRGIGRRIALRCADHGADVVLAARSGDALEAVRAEIEQLGRQGQVIVTDVSDRASVMAMAQAAIERWGKIDVLVNNSGIGGPSAPLWEVDPAEWAETLDVNVTGVFNCCQAVVPSMIEQGHGSIITIGSMTGKRPLLNRTAYATSKAALIGLVRTLAEEVGPHGLRANLISPGTVEGERIDWVFENQAKAQGRPVDEVRADFVNMTPLKRLVAPDDIGNTVVYLASDLSSGVTGADINVSAGLVMY